MAIMLKKIWLWVTALVLVVTTVFLSIPKSAVILEGPVVGSASPIAFDSFEKGTPSANTCTFNHTVTGTNTILVVYIQTRSSHGATSVTYNGVSMTNVGVSADDGIFNLWSFILVNPASGTHSVVGTTTTTMGTCNAASYTGAAQTGQPDAHNELLETASGDRTISMTVVTNNSWLVVSHYSNNADPTAAVNGTDRTTLGDLDLVDSNAGVGTGAQTIGYHWAASDRHPLVGVAIAPIAGGASTANPLKVIEESRANKMKPENPVNFA